MFGLHFLFAVLCHSERSEESVNVSILNCQAHVIRCFLRQHDRDGFEP